MPEPDYSGVPCDFAIENRGSLSRLIPLTRKAEDWCAVNMPPNRFSKCPVAYWLEAREVKDTVVKIESIGLTVRRM